MKNMLFLFVIIVGSLLRLWQLGGVPISPDWDEAALGYNAYSIMQTGRDEYGEFLPIVLRSFDDYKPALYAYLVIPFIKLFGLSIFAVRLPSAIFGIVTIIAIYFLVKELFKGARHLALLSSFLLAISPWHIQFSRVAFESNVGVALNVLGVLFFLKSFKKSWFLLLSALMFGLGLHVYQSEKVFVPLLIIMLVFIFKKNIFSMKKSLIISLLLFSVIALPLVSFTLINKDTFARARSVSIFSDVSIANSNVDKIREDKENNDFLGVILDNRRVEFAKRIIAGYLSHFDINWLFITGDIARHHAPSMGLMYIFELPFLLVGIYSLTFGDFSRKAKLLLLLWILIVPIPVSVTNDVPHSVRTLNFLPTFQILTAIGIFSALQKVSNFQVRYLVLPLSFLFFIFNFFYYLNQYFVQQNYFHARYWQYGYKEIVNYIAPIYNNYNKIIVSNMATMDQSYMFFLFYLRYDPHKYLSEGGTKSGKLEYNGNKFANFEFRKFNYYEENEKNILLIGSPFDFQEVFRTLHEANFPDKSLAIKIVEKNK